MSNKVFKQFITNYELVYLACISAQKKLMDMLFKSIMEIVLENYEEKSKNI